MAVISHGRGSRSGCSTQHEEFGEIATRLKFAGNESEGNDVVNHFSSAKVDRR